MRLLTLSGGTLACYRRSRKKRPPPLARRSRWLHRRRRSRSRRRAPLRHRPVSLRPSRRRPRSGNSLQPGQRFPLRASWQLVGHPKSLGHRWPESNRRWSRRLPLLHRPQPLLPGPCLSRLSRCLRHPDRARFSRVRGSRFRPPWSRRHQPLHPSRSALLRLRFRTLRRLLRPRGLKSAPLLPGSQRLAPWCLRVPTWLHGSHSRGPCRASRSPE